MFSQRVSTIRQSHSLPFYSLCLLFILLTAFLIPLYTPTRALASTDPFTITSESASAVFAKEIDYQVGVQDRSSTITQATLTVTFKGFYNSTQKYNVPIATPSQTLHLSWHEDISGANFLFSGTPIIYVWQFQDSNANVHIGDYQNLTVIDNRFSWKQLSQGLLQVHWYNQGSDFGQIILSQALDSIKRISSNLGSPPKTTINLWVYQTANDFRGALPPSTFEWVGGLAYPPLNEAFVVVDSPNSETLVRDMPHELTHVIFHQLTDGVNIPTWFDEGLAVYNQIYHEPEMKQRFDDALTSHSLLRFDTLTDGFPADSDKAYLAYAQSWQFVSYLYNTYGLAKMAQFINGLKNDGGVFDAEVRQVFGEDSTHIENQWLISLHQPAILASTPQTQVTPQPIHKTLVLGGSTTDTTAPWLISIGILLILLSLGGFSILVVYQRQRTKLVAQVASRQSSQSTSSLQTQPAYTPRLSAPPTPDAFEQYTQSTVPYLDASAQAAAYRASSYRDPSLIQPSPTEQITGQGVQTGEQDDVTVLRKKLPSLAFEQDYTYEPPRTIQQGQHGQQEQSPQE